MDKNTNTLHSINEPSTSKSILYNESADTTDYSVNVVENDKNEENDKRRFENEISSTEAQIPKKTKKDEENETEMAAIVASNQEQSSEFYKLPFELLADTFDNLPLKDLCSIRQTSKWFHQVAGFCYRKNYSALERSLRDQKGIDLNAFNELIQALEIYREEHFLMHEHYPNGRSEFKQIKKIRFTCLDLKYVKFEEIKEFVGEIEHLEIDGCGIAKSFVSCMSSIHDMCRAFKNIKRLSMLNRKPETEWVVCEFPKLERFELDAPYENINIGKFLKYNPNIRKLGIDVNCLRRNVEAMKSVQLEDLAIRISNIPRPTYSSKAVCNLLNELHELGSFKRLKIYILRFDRTRRFTDLSSLQGLIKLHMDSMTHDIDRTTKRSCTRSFPLSMFSNLEEISIPFSCTINDIEATADNLKDLERIQFDYADIDDIKIFLTRSKKLAKIKVKYFVCAASCIEKNERKIIYNNTDDAVYNLKKENVLNLLKLNAERANLKDAKPVTLYVTEEVYLATKWASRKIDFEFIQLKRHESFEWDSDFYQK